ncbi:hypothetical protein DICPUDRAFT_79338 [Dictyostelium purpureum]|uniref:Uncharacterized protein n=1 Tax=Dictyostelium purpureum TaxID=5786 RepID=F0ZMA2_DICPU|nr:uncharacterized protein DICPUDRAFT_79338 [Dictyostelium purpureum]EGC34923.1 hypothetical protein DICPUDRAFT_79338 [Dictyostelium purpureum]|eukprot:XP_003288556.1 hypothetical protein DICPUDRAFT_79338 [Dictyostelium purpureum]
MGWYNIIIYIVCSRFIYYYYYYYYIFLNDFKQLKYANTQSSGFTCLLLNLQKSAPVAFDIASSAPSKSVTFESLSSTGSNFNNNFKPQDLIFPQFKKHKIQYNSNFISKHGYSFGKL